MISFSSTSQLNPLNHLEYQRILGSTSHLSATYIAEAISISSHIYVTLEQSQDLLTQAVNQDVATQCYSHKLSNTATHAKIPATNRTLVTLADVSPVLREHNLEHHPAVIESSTISRILKPIEILNRMAYNPVCASTANEDASSEWRIIFDAKILPSTSRTTRPKADLKDCWSKATSK
ncbi:hypothetical protein J1N35_007206 [Gossypium stocksii]|uniref:Uncharacterized protein n=1 Tax=Gossypium stocksii TaxID=47602 RepID=A0A9D3W732_9ROSI|nr:hypothetical protein J1N35_007206 [Gossypium stocksii]